jgi:hypothetical protein
MGEKKKKGNIEKQGVGSPCTQQGLHYPEVYLMSSFLFYGGNITMAFALLQLVN